MNVHSGNKRRRKRHRISDRLLRRLPDHLPNRWINKLASCGKSRRGSLLGHSRRACVRTRALQHIMCMYLGRSLVSVTEMRKAEVDTPKIGVATEATSDRKLHLNCRLGPNPRSLHACIPADSRSDAGNTSTGRTPRTSRYGPGSKSYFCWHTANPGVGDEHRIDNLPVSQWSILPINGMLGLH